MLRFLDVRFSSQIESMDCVELEWLALPVENVDGQLRRIVIIESIGNGIFAFCTWLSTEYTGSTSSRVYVIPRDGSCSWQTRGRERCVERTFQCFVIWAWHFYLDGQSQRSASKNNVVSTNSEGEATEMRLLDKIIVDWRNDVDAFTTRSWVHSSDTQRKTSF